MLRKLMLAVIPMACLAGVVRADDVDGLTGNFATTANFEVDALTAAINGDELVADNDVLAVSGSEATEDVDAEGVCFYGGWGYGHYGYCGYRTFNYYRPFVHYHTYYTPVYAPVYSYYGWNGYGCW
jgi:hypothetical protein